MTLFVLLLPSAVARCLLVVSAGAANPLVVHDHEKWFCDLVRDRWRVSALTAKLRPALMRSVRLAPVTQPATTPGPTRPAPAPSQPGPSQPARARRLTWSLIR